MGAFSGTMLVLLLQAWLLQASSAEFLTPVLDHGNANLPLCQQETVVSCNLVKIDLDSLDASTVAFMGATLDFLDQPGDNTYTFSSEDGAEASFTVDLDLGAVWGHAQLADGRDFIIEPDLDNCDGCHVVIEEDQGAFPHDLAETPPPPSGEETRSNAALLDMGKTDSTTLVTYSIMLYYTPEVKAAVDDVRLMADQVIATTNQGYINSKIPLRAVLHCIEETNEPESAFTLDNRDQGRLGYFRQYKDGGNSLRGSADAAVLIVKDAQGVCGVGYKLRDASNYNDWMVSLTELSCVLGGYTFGHELGHNMGLDHDKYADVTRNTPYSQGYHLPGTRYRTILAYSHGDHRLRANHYSNPRVNFKDVPTGDAETADAARRMTEIRFVIGAIGDESETCTTLPAPTTTPTPTTTQAPTTTPAPTTTQAPTTVPPTITANCTDDGSYFMPGTFLIQNDRDSRVMADNTFGKTVLQKPIVGDLTQEWKAAPLCNGADKLLNVAPGRWLVSRPKDTWTSGAMDEWTYNWESKVIQAEDGRYVRSTKKKGLKITKKVRYLKGTETPWKWFQWSIVPVMDEFTF